METATRITGKDGKILRILNVAEKEDYIKLHTKVNDSVRVIDQEIKDLANNMLATMYHNHGIGLAATQVDVLKRVVVMDISDPETIKGRGVIMGESDTQDIAYPLILINPEYTPVNKNDKKIGQEGCLSVPNIYDNVERFSEVIVKYLTIDNECVEAHWTGLPAVCIQHEIDHLDGVVFVDHLSKLKQDLIKKKLKKQRLQQE